MKNLVVHLDHRLREIVQESALNRTNLRIVIGMVLQIGGAEGERTIECMLLVIGAGTVNRLLLCGIHVDLTGACQQNMGLVNHCLHKRADAVWRVIIVIIHDYDDIPRCLFSEIVELGAHWELLVTVLVAEMVCTEVHEEVFDWLRAVVKDEPLHHVVIIVLLLVDLNEPRDEAAPVVSGRDYGDEH